METEETEGLPGPPVASPIIEAAPTTEEIEKHPVPCPASPAIEPISLSQPSLESLEEPSRQNETLDRQPANVLPPQQSHYPVMKEALKVLLENTVSVVEYGTQVLYRCGYAEPLLLVEWVVPNSQLLLASQLLLENNWPRLLYYERDWKYPESWEAQCLMHDLDGQGGMRVHLIPLSLVGFTLEDTVEVPSSFAHEFKLLTPTPPHYMSSLIRHLLQLPVGHISRIRVEKDLMGFISAYILKDEPVDMTTLIHRKNPESEEDYQKRVEKGIQFMKTWDWSKIEERYITMAECAVQDCRYIDTLTDVNSGNRMF
ncbi:uncharacterized protein PGRI_040640 [Penicillium griseofulvum]|uniref:Uncharacterized protein n=1 Tax=Penicillium patulum TaxID=5078 RepID=A0A135L859_PENPA|nr:uncharacterized protein PGRI_040640 [Penicillium griseofulvum]KXG45151.1 hypothetical protein PGRI_040640 [Penicillium griseofulvum]